MTNMKADIGIVEGEGLSRASFLKGRKRLNMQTRFGKPPGRAKKVAHVLWIDNRAICKLTDASSVQES